MLFNFIVVGWNRTVILVNHHSQVQNQYVLVLAWISWVLWSRLLLYRKETKIADPVNDFLKIMHASNLWVNSKYRLLARMCVFCFFGFWLFLLYRALQTQTNKKTHSLMGELESIQQNVMGLRSVWETYSEFLFISIQIQILNLYVLY